MNRKRFLVSGYGEDLSSNVGVFSYNENSLNKVEFIDVGERPSYFLQHKNIFYFACEVGEQFHGKIGYIVVIEKKGRNLIKLQKIEVGNCPCHISISEDEKYLIVSNYFSSNIVILEISKNGTLKNISDFKYSGKSINKDRQECSHPHCSLMINGKLYVADLGLDRIHVYQFNDSLESVLVFIYDIELEPGSGPRLIKYDAKNKKILVVCELNNTLVILSMSGNILQKYKSTSNNKIESYVSDIVFYKHYYLISNRGIDTISYINTLDNTIIERKCIACPRSIYQYEDKLFILSQTRNCIVVKDLNSFKTLSSISFSCPTCICFLQS